MAENQNKKRWIGVWMDYREARIVTLHDSKGISSFVTSIDSNVKPKHKTTGGVSSGSPFYSRSMYGHAHDQEKNHHEVTKYFLAIDKCLLEAQAVCIFGPGKAKIEYQKHLEKSKPMNIGSVEVFTAQKMTEKQFVAKVRDFYKCLPSN